MYAGDALHIDARALKADGLGQDLLGASVIWTVSDKDENVVLTKNLSSGISVTDRVTGLLRITVLASETSEWYATRYTHRAVLTDYVGNAVTLMTGSIFVLSR